MALPTRANSGAYLQQLPAAHRTRPATAPESPGLLAAHLHNVPDARQLFHVARPGAAQVERRKHPPSGRPVSEASAAHLLRQLVLATDTTAQLVRADRTAHQNSECEPLALFYAHLLEMLFVVSSEPNTVSVWYSNLYVYFGNDY